MKKYFFCETRYLTAILAAIGIALMVFYLFCDTSCRYLAGSILGLDLEYLGMVYMGVVLLLCFTHGRKLLPLFLSFGVGAEAFLVGYQVATGVYCPYCLVFAAIVALMFAINFDRTKIRPMILSLLAGLALFALLFTGSPTPAYAEDNLITSFGRGPVSVRIYTDYFCGPCSALEGDLGPVISDLMRKEKISLAFIDTPIHGRKTTLYAKYFLYILHEKRDFNHALAARAALFAAAGSGIKDSGALESFLAQKEIPFRVFDVWPTLREFEKYLRADRINSTPTVVVSIGGKREKLKGGTTILKGLKRLAE